MKALFSSTANNSQVLGWIVAWFSRSTVCFRGSRCMTTLVLDLQICLPKNAVETFNTTSAWLGWISSNMNILINCLAACPSEWRLHEHWRGALKSYCWTNHLRPLML